MKGPEELAREKIDAGLEAAGWTVQDPNKVDLSAGRGIAVREFPLVRGHGYADYLLYVDAKAAGVIEAKKDGTPLTVVEVQTVKYSEGSFSRTSLRTTAGSSPSSTTSSGSPRTSSIPSPAW